MALEPFPEVGPKIPLTSKLEDIQKETLLKSCLADKTHADDGPRGAIGSECDY